MKKIQIKKALLAAAMLAGVGMAYGNGISNNVVYCTANIISGPKNGALPMVSVSLPPTEGYYDNYGNPVTIWNVGDVPAGGVADSWHGEGGPGRFTAKNTGNVKAYFYITTGSSQSYSPMQNAWTGQVTPLPNVMNEGMIRDVLGLEGKYLNAPCISPHELYGWPYEGAYHLAFTTDTTAKVPTWHSLDKRFQNGNMNIGADKMSSTTVGFMGTVIPGDYLTFDLKFWAHPRAEWPAIFTFCVEASEFPLWDHGRAVE